MTPPILPKYQLNKSRRRPKGGLGLNTIQLVVIVSAIGLFVLLCTTFYMAWHHLGPKLEWHTRAHLQNAEEALHNFEKGIHERIKRPRDHANTIHRMKRPQMV